MMDADEFRTNRPGAPVLFHYSGNICDGAIYLTDEQSLRRIIDIIINASQSSNGDYCDVHFDGFSYTVSRAQVRRRR